MENNFTLRQLQAVTYDISVYVARGESSYYGTMHDVPKYYLDSPVEHIDYRTGGMMDIFLGYPQEKD